MAEKKKKKVNVRSSSFREIVDGEIIRQPDIRLEVKKIDAKPRKAEKRPRYETTARSEEKPKLVLSAKDVVEKREPRRSSGFRVIENGEYIDKETRSHGDIIKAPEAKRRKPEQPGKHVKVEITEGEPEKIERSLKNCVIEGMFNSASGSIQTSFTAPLALALGASSTQIGLMTSLQNLTGTVSHIPGAMLTKFWSRKHIWLVTQVLSKILLWVPIMLLPLLPVENRVWMLIILLAVSNFFLYVRSPAWSSLMGDLVPQNIRGRYFGRRNMFIAVSGLLATLAAGFLLQYWGFPGIFLMSIVLAAVAIIFFVKMYEPPVERVFHYKYNFRFNPRGWWTSLRINKEFVIFTSYLTFMNFAFEIAAPFYVVYMLKNLSIGYEWFAIAVVIGAVFRATTQQYWGRMEDKFGSRKILIICGIMTCFIPFFWIFASSIFHVIMIKIYDGVIYSGFELIIFNYLLDVTPAKNRPKYVAAHSFVTGIGLVLGSMLGAFLVFNLEASSFMWFAGLQIVFLVSFSFRLAFSFMLLAIRNIDYKKSDSLPVGYVFWQALAVEPVHGMKHAISFTFRYPFKVEQGLRENVKKLESRIKLTLKS